MFKEIDEEQEQEKPKITFSEVVVPKGKSLDKLVKHFSRRYKLFKTKSEKENKKLNLLNSSSKNYTPKEIKDEVKKYMNDKWTINERGIIPAYGFYEKLIAPRLINLIKGNCSEHGNVEYELIEGTKLNKEELDRFKEISELSLNILKTSQQIYVSNNSEKRHAIQTIFDQYFNNMHSEPEDIILAFTEMQIRKARGHFHDDERVLKDYELKEFLDLFKPYKKERIGNTWTIIPKENIFEKYKKDFIEIVGLTGSGSNAHSYLKNLDEILEILEQDPDLIPTYIRLSKAQKYIDNYGPFNFGELAIVDELRKLVDLGDISELAINCYEQALKIREYWLKPDSQDSIRRFIGKIENLKKEGLECEVPLILKQATIISEHGINGIDYLYWVTDAKKNNCGDQRPFLQYLLDIAKINPRAGRHYAFRHGKEMKLPSKLREKYHAIGMNLIRSFGEPGASFFDDGLIMLEQFPEKFDSWLDRFTHVAENKIRLLDKFSDQSIKALQRNYLDEMIDVSFYFDNLLRKRASETKEQERVTSNDDMDFFSEFHKTKEARVNPVKHANNVFKLSDQIYKFSIEHVLWDVIHHGTDYDKYVELAVEMVKTRLENISTSKIKEVINSDMHVQKKMNLMREYKVARVLMDEKELPELDLNGKWKDECKEKIIEQLKENYNFDLTNVEFKKLVMLYELRANQFGRVHPTIHFIVDKYLKGEIFSKNFSLGKEYGIMPVENEELNQTMDNLKFKIQKGTLEDLFHQDNLGSRIFYPRADSSFPCVKYLLNEAIGLLHLIPERDGYEQDAQGVAVLVDVFDIKTGDQCLLVDAIYTGEFIQKNLLEQPNKDSNKLIEKLHESIMQVAKDMKMDKVIYYSGEDFSDEEQPLVDYLRPYSKEYEFLKTINPVNKKLIESPQDKKEKENKNKDETEDNAESIFEKRRREIREKKGKDKYYELVLNSPEKRLLDELIKNKLSRFKEGQKLYELAQKNRFNYYDDDYDDGGMNWHGIIERHRELKEKLKRHYCSKLESFKRHWGLIDKHQIKEHIGNQELDRFEMGGYTKGIIFQVNSQANKDNS
ncbi:hypothetical protein HOK51_08490 [Candidatus Woesearchaeota archaeon]|jgi:hypothetical protein|nr:hypothetical protein [Candidatus Woesearchaeota archaeon]MBT6519864.1 hypothetical protein [Candidatus Woesearchaeota archaeon]MBT7367156.1 hypothetical protein [Candidatus Woesearchaeota archaeon]